MNISIDIQMACSSEGVPDVGSMRRWVSAAIRNERDIAELSVRIVDEQESAALNQQYRGNARTVANTRRSSCLRASGYE